MVGPMVVSSDIVDVRHHYLGANAVFHDANLTCYNARGEAAGIVLVPGRHVHIDLIVRAAHTTTWIPNDPRTPLDCFGACNGKTGTFVDCPLIFGLVSNHRTSKSFLRQLSPARAYFMVSASGDTSYCAVLSNCATF